MKALINTPTPSLNQSLDFYSALNYECVSIEDNHYAISGDLVIRINPNNLSRPGMVYFKENWDVELEKISADFHIESKEKSYFIADPNGVIIELCPLESYPDIDTKSDNKEIPGSFSGVSLEAFDIKKSLSFYSILGYKKTMGSEEAGWISMGNDSALGIALMKFNMCPHLFFNPSLTYFNSGQNMEIIDKVRAAGIDITEEITVFNKEGIVDNIIIRDPGGYGFFIFND